MSGDPAAADEIRTGARYEAERGAVRRRLAGSAAARRVDLGGDLVLVFESAETVRAALEETLRAERIDDPEEVAAETAAFAGLRPGPGALAATLYVDVADPAALADRLGELEEAAGSLALEAGGERVAARRDDGEPGAGALRVVFSLGADRAAAIDGGMAVAVTVDQPRRGTRVALSGEQARALAACIER